MRSKIFSRALRARKRLHGHVGVGQDSVHCLGHSRGQLPGALEGHSPRQSHGKIGEVAVPGPADADAVDLEHAFDAQHRIVNFGAHARRRSIEQRINRAARQPPTHGNDHSCHEQRCNGIGIAQPLDVIRPAQQHQDKPKHHHAGRPDVGGEMQSVGLQRLAVVFGGDAAQRARTPPVDPHGEQHHGKSGQRRLDFNVAEEQTQRRLVNNPGAGQQQQSGLDEGGEIFDLAMTVLMVGVGRLVGDADREKSQQRRNQVEPGVRRFRENAEAARAESDHDLQPVITTAASTELPAAARFSARINSDEGMAGFPDMQELSPLRSGKRQANRGRFCSTSGLRTSKGRLCDSVALAETRQNRPLVLGFGAE